MQRFAVVALVSVHQFWPRDGLKPSATSAEVRWHSGCISTEPLQMQDIGPHLHCTEASPGLPGDAFFVAQASWVRPSSQPRERCR
jgi:hypothetical protein